ncbi:hypothetical protein [Mycobacteroides abscessus]|uniref:hypothetical protein n=1 Tax=Mycobacteroides abscessus TaxID=36809 RepID=UPI00266CCD2D|nr:hypothetical protein [Mycobacteroides abscessus]MDO3175896.1 hypothetical protein [Mycobacteroides abscessus subsp. abscessus]
MSDTLVTFLLTWLFWWLLLFSAYAVLLFGVDALLRVLRRRQQARRVLRMELERLDRQAEASVYRIGVAFGLAQQLIRVDVASSRGGTHDRAR